MKSSFYDVKLDQWDDMLIYSPAPRHRRRVVLKLLKKYAQENASLHDIGCGNGFFLREIKKKFNNLALSGSDISEITINRINKLFEDINFTVFNFGKKINGELDRYDIITCCEVIEHIENLKIAINNFKKILKPGGIVILTLPRGKIYPIDKMVGHYRHFDDILIFKNYFSVVKQIHWGFPFLNLYKWAINLFPEFMNETFCNAKYYRLKKILSNFLYYLFFFNLPFGGNQLVLILKLPK